MELKYGDVVKMRRKSCRKCFTLVYHVSCKVDGSLADYLISLGSPKFDLNTVKLFRIETEDQYAVKTRLGRNDIQLALPKELENTNIENNTRKLEFEEGLVKWLESKLNVTIVK